ncbi:uncharacterized protein LOC131950140 [Physella acuta]|uniref:uncharacterized protein LOC131950140 n=1 Tax=Physella acuta TaxID=109671 RepID=UPI0027DE6966|nr:uncharacterized protein LOC131950140 [Physella acuta]
MQLLVPQRLAVVPFVVMCLLHELVPAQDENGEVFKHADVNEDGVLSLGEYQNSFSMYDGNNDTRIEKKEYLDFYKETAMKFWSYYDLNNDCVLNDKDYKPLFNQTDADGDKTVTLAEFQKWTNS